MEVVFDIEIHRAYRHAELLARVQKVYAEQSMLGYADLVVEINVVDCYVINFDTYIRVGQDIVEVKQTCGNIQLVVYEIAYGLGSKYNLYVVFTRLEIGNALIGLFIDKLIIILRSLYKRNPVGQILLDKQRSVVTLYAVLVKLNVVGAFELINFSVFILILSNFILTDGDEHRIFDKIDKGFGVKTEIKRNSEAEICNDLLVDVIGKQQRMQEGIERGIFAVLVELSNPLAERPIRAALICAEVDSTLKLEENGGNLHIAVAVEQRNFDITVLIVLKIGSQILFIFALAHGNAVEHIPACDDIDIRGIKLRAYQGFFVSVVYLEVERNLLAASACERIPDNVNPRRNVGKVKADKLVESLDNALHNSDLQLFRGERSHHGQGKLFLGKSLRRAVALRNRQSLLEGAVGIYIYSTVLSNNLKEDIKYIHRHTELIDAEVTAVHVQTFTRIIQAEKHLFGFAEFLTGKLDKQLGATVLGVYVLVAEQIAHNRRKVKTSAHLKLILKRTLLVEADRNSIREGGHKLIRLVVEIVQQSLISGGNGILLYGFIGNAVAVKPVSAFSAEIDGSGALLDAEI